MKLPVLWDSSQFDAVLALSNVTIGFLLYWFVSQSEKAVLFFKNKYGENHSVPFVLFQRYTGVLFLGVLPILFTMIFSEKSLESYGIIAYFNLEALYWWLGLLVIIVPMNYLNAKKADNLAVYPQIRVLEWRLKTFFQEYSSWIAYLVAYELLFRGLLLYACASAMGAWVAIALNTAIYATVHIPKGQKEAVGAVPLGILLSYLTFKTGSVWLAVLVHISLALSSSFFSFLAQPSMYFKNK